MILEDFKVAGYSVQYKVLNAADFGVPQKRERVIFIGVRNDIDFNISFPKPTHANPDLISKNGMFEHRKPWVTIGEALLGLPNPDEVNELQITHTQN